MSQTVELHPLQATADRADTAHEWLAVAYGGPLGEGWLRCSDVDASVIADWEARVADRHREMYGRSHPMASSSYVLGWYADVAGSVGALCFRLDRRVPGLGRRAVAFRPHPEMGYAEAVTLLDSSFWCLPDDPAADHPDATVVADERALAAVLRAEVRRHADDFLAAYRPGARLPRRNLLGAFFDSVDGGFWVDDAHQETERACVAAARLALPGSTE